MFLGVTQLKYLIRPNSSEGGFEAVDLEAHTAVVLRITPDFRHHEAVFVVLIAIHYSR